MKKTYKLLLVAILTLGILQGCINNTPKSGKTTYTKEEMEEINSKVSEKVEASYQENEK